MKTLRDLCVEKICKLDPEEIVFEWEVFKDAEINYIRNMYKRLKRKKDIHFFQLCKMYYLFYLFSDREEIVYYNIDIENLSHWQLAQLCACEIKFGHYHSAQSAVERIRMELPFEHLHGRSKEFTTDAFEAALEKFCPNMKGSVHDWYKVFMKVPTKILLYEEFFG
jgi:hypothetical protein